MCYLKDMADRHLKSVDNSKDIALTPEIKELVKRLGDEGLTMSEKLKTLGRIGIDKEMLGSQSIIDEDTYDAYLNGLEVDEQDDDNEDGIFITNISFIAAHMLYNGLSVDQTRDILNSRVKFESAPEFLIGRVLIRVAALEFLMVHDYISTQYGDRMPPGFGFDDLPPAA